MQDSHLTGHEIGVACTDGAAICVRRLAKAGAPRLLLSHGNGFAIDGYRLFWSLLADEFELCLFDLRNHGRNPRHDIEHHTQAAMAADHVSVHAAVETAFGLRPTIGVFHSVSSVAAIRAAAEHGARWDALVLVDPPLIAPAGYEVREENQRLDTFLADLSRKRRHHFGNPDELAAEFRQRSGRNWAPGAEFDMARAVTRPAGDDGYELSCPGEYEARIYLDNARYDSFAAMQALAQPTMILGADPDAPRPLPPALSGPLAARRYGLAHVVIPGTGHLLQIEKPAESAAAVRRFVRDYMAARG